MKSIYAVFSDRQKGRVAHQWLRDRLGEDVDLELLDKPEHLSHQLLPLRVAEAHAGAISGGVAVAFVTVLTFALGVCALGVSQRDSLLSPVPTAVLCIVLAAVLGAVAGALAFSTRSKRLIRRLRTHLRRNQPVVLLRGPSHLVVELWRLGAIRVGVCPE